MSGLTVREMLIKLVEDIEDIKEIMVIAIDHEDEILTGFSNSEHNIKTIGALEVGKDMIKANLLE